MRVTAASSCCVVACRSRAPPRRPRRARRRSRSRPRPSRPAPSATASPGCPRGRRTGARCRRCEKGIENATASATHAAITEPATPLHRVAQLDHEPSHGAAPSGGRRDGRHLGLGLVRRVTVSGAQPRQQRQQRALDLGAGRPRWSGAAAITLDASTIAPSSMCASGRASWRFSRPASIASCSAIETTPSQRSGVDRAPLGPAEERTAGASRCEMPDHGAVGAGVQERVDADRERIPCVSAARRFWRRSTAAARRRSGCARRGRGRACRRSGGRARRASACAGQPRTISSVPTSA